MTKQIWMQENLKAGEIYAGLILGKKGQPDYHLFLLPEKTNKLDWNTAMTWAASISGYLPSRCEQSLLIANCKEEFEGYYYWSSEQDADYAWMQHFYYGNQDYCHKSNEYRARAVRRIILEGV